MSKAHLDQIKVNVAKSYGNWYRNKAQVPVRMVRGSWRRLSALT